MPLGQYVHPLFGLVEFETKNKTKWVRGDGITFTKGFNPAEVTTVIIPQLAGIPGAHGGKLSFHNRGHKQLLNTFADIERMGLLHHIKTCAGSLNMRLKKPTSGALSKQPSNHAFGIAIDLNSDDGSLGSSVAPVAPVFQANGFKWGISFNDPMHFEIESFIDNPKPVATQVKVVRSTGATLELGAFNFQGKVVADMALVRQVLRLVETGRTSQFMFVAPASKPDNSTKLPFRTVGGKDYAPLLQAAGVAGLSMIWDNDSKLATLG